MATPGKRRPERIGAILRERIASLGWERRLQEEEVVTGWDAAVGAQIAAHARPSHVANHRLIVVTESPVWTQQLALLKPDLLRRLASRFGDGTVTDLFFVTGRIEAAPASPATGPSRPPPPAQLPPGVEAELAAIADPEVRDSVRRLILASLADAPAR